MKCGRERGEQGEVAGRGRESAGEDDVLVGGDAAQIEEYARRLEDLVYDMDSETMLAVIGELEQCSYCGKPLVKPLAKVRRKIEMADYMSALDTFEQICASIEAWGKGKENAQKA